MANIRVDALTEVTTIADDDVVMVDGKQGVRATTWAALKNLIKQQCGINELNTNMIYSPFVLNKWCDGSEQINLVIDVSKAEKRRLPIFVGGNVGNESFLQMGVLDNLGGSSTEINFKAVLPIGSGAIRAYANLHNNNANMYRILVQGVSGMGQHIFVIIPAVNIRLENTW